MRHQDTPTAELETQRIALRSLIDEARARFDLPGDESTAAARRRLHARFVREMDAVTLELDQRRKAAGQTSLDIPTNIHPIGSKRAA